MPNRPVPEEAITADNLIAVLGQALDADAQLPTPEDAGFAPNAIRDFLEFVQAHGGFEVPTGRTGNEPVHFGSLMGGLVIGAVAARAAAPAIRKQEREQVEKLERALEEAEDRFESCDNCERPSRKQDLKVIWCKDGEGGEAVDARICLVCRLESQLQSEREQVLEEVREGLERCVENQKLRLGSMPLQSIGRSGSAGHVAGLEEALRDLAALHPDQSKGER
jgi:hypothetical protein